MVFFLSAWIQPPLYIVLFLLLVDIELDAVRI